MLVKLFSRSSALSDSPVKNVSDTDRMDTAFLWLVWASM